MKEDLKEIFSLLKRKNLPFCFYSLPNSSDVQMVVHDSVTADLSKEMITNNEPGFIYRSFDKSEKPKFIPSSFYGLVSAFKVEQFNFLQDFVMDEQHLAPSNSELSKEEYLLKVKEIVKRIKNGDIDKLVFSRSKKLSNKKSAVDLFETIRKSNPHAFNYLLRTEGGQIWFGASPEILLEKNENRYRTVALAGTVKNEDSATLFSEKNKEEQQFVTDFIRENLKELSATNIAVADPIAMSASNVTHIKTAITFDLQEDDLQQIINCTEGLHPTPAVAGTPQEAAIQNILDVENYNRSLYAGYLGPINIEGITATYVNIRCAQYFDDHVELYVGGGITKDSDPEMEWEETENKAALITNAVMCT